MDRGVPVTVGREKKKTPIKHSAPAATDRSPTTATPARHSNLANQQSPHLQPHRPSSTPQHRTASPRLPASRIAAPTFAQPTLFSLLASAPDSPPVSASSPSLPTSAASSTSSAVRSSIESELTMSRVDRRKAKKKRKLILSGKGHPTVHDIHSVYGPSPRASIQLKLHEYFQSGSLACLRAREVHQLIGWVLGEEVSPKWVFVKNKALVEQVVLLVIDGLSWAAWQQRKVECERLRAFFQPEESEQPVRVVVKTSLFSPHTVLQDYCSVAIKRERTDRNGADSSYKRQKTAEESSADESKQAAIDPLELCLTETEMRDNKYPMEGEERDFLSSCDHHQLDEEERRWKVAEARMAGLYCIHTHPTQGEEEAKSDGGGRNSHDGVGATAELEMEVLAERMDEEGDREDGEIREDEAELERKEDKMEDDFVLHTSSPTSHHAASYQPSSSSSLPPLSASFPPLFAIDCEMCYTSVGLELTRLTLIDSQCRTLLDTLVVPTNPITNYNTQYSGITAAMLAQCTTTLQQARHRLLSLLPASAILVGHSAENDLRASRIYHRRVVDTALLFPHPRGPPHKSSLRYLVQRWLNREIQTGGGGHDSVEDAWAAMELVCEKVRRGREWGIQRGDTELLTDVVARQGRKVCWVGSAMGGKRWGGRTAAVIATSTDEQTTDRSVKAVSGGEYGLVIAHYTSLHARLEEEAAVAADEPGRDMRVAAAMRHMDGLVTAVLKASRVNSVLIVLSGQGSTAGVKAMQRAKAEMNEGRGDAAIAAPSTEQLDAQINAAVTELQSGVGWFAVRQ